MVSMKKGFTLVELLAVIVVIAVISLISVPLVLGNIESSKQASFKASANEVIDAARAYVSKYDEDNDFPIGGIDVTTTNLKAGKLISKEEIHPVFLRVDSELADKSKK